MPSREEKKAATRKKLLDAAAVLVARDGAMATTLDAIAEKAGLTKGAVYSNFASKEDLLFALAEAAELPQVGLEDFFDPEQSLADNLERLGRALALELSSVSQRAWQLGLELEHFAQRNPRARRRLAAEQRRSRGEAASIWEALAASRGEPLPLPAEQLDVVVGALALGLAQKAAIDRSAVPDDLFAKAFRLLAGPA